ncbi:MAG: hypothetical protein AAF802_18465 [Planctomycetota bacterium]
MGIGELSVAVTARTQKATRNITSFRKSIGTIPAVVSRANASIAGMATAAGGLLGVAAGVNQLRKSFERIDSIAKTADKIGIATEQLSGLRLAAKETGVETSVLDTSLQRMVRRISEASHGTGEAKNALAELGLNAQRLASMSPDRQFHRLASAMEDVKNSGDRVRLAMKLFDSEGVSLINTLKLGSDGLTRYQRDAEKLGLTVSRIDAMNVEKANDAYARMGLTIQGLSNTLAVKLAPAVELVSKGVASYMQQWKSGLPTVNKGVMQMRNGLAFTADVIEGVRRNFLSMKATALESLSGITLGANTATKALAETLDAIPGITARNPAEMQGLADMMESMASHARKQADAAFSKPLPSMQVHKFFDEVDSRVANVKSSMDEAFSSRTMIQRVETIAGPSAQGVGALVANISQGLMRASQQAAGTIGGVLAQKPIRIEMTQGGERGSREEFNLLRQIQHREANKLANETRKQTTALTKAGRLLERMLEKLDDSDDKFDRMVQLLENAPVVEAS